MNEFLINARTTGCSATPAEGLLGIRRVLTFSWHILHLKFRLGYAGAASLTAAEFAFKLTAAAAAADKTELN